MSMMITAADAKRAIQSAEAAHSRLKRLRANGEKITEEVGRTLVTSGTGFALGLVQGAGFLTNGEILKIPLELGVGLAFHAMRLFGLGGEKHGSILSDIGNGGLTSYLHILGRGIGAEHWGKAKTSGEMSGALADRLAQLAA